VTGYDYTKTLMGVCGHVVDAWPALHRLGYFETVYACRDCSIVKYGQDGWNDGRAVFVKEKPLTFDEQLAKEEKKETARRKRTEPKKKKRTEYVPVRADGVW
jgi:hypothetical protein